MTPGAMRATMKLKAHMAGTHQIAMAANLTEDALLMRSSLTTSKHQLQKSKTRQTFSWAISP
jgi:hypothetical protein